MSRILLVTHGSTSCIDLSRVFLSFINKYTSDSICIPINNGGPFGNLRIIILLKTVSS